MATSTFFGHLVVSGNASTSNLFISSIATGNLLKTTTAGSIVAAVAGVDFATALGAFDFTPTTNYAVNTSATSTSVWVRLGLFASSTSQFDQINVGSSTVSQMATSTFFGNLSIRGAASTTNLFVSSVVTGSLLKVTTAGSVIAAAAGVDFATVAGAFDFTPTTSFGTSANSTSTLIVLANGLSASSTIRFGNPGGDQLSFNSATGRLGLGTTTPYAQFAIFASSTNGVALPTSLFVIASSTSGLATSTIFNVFNNGQVGIGTSSVATTTTFIVQGANTAGSVVAAFTNGTGTCTIDPTGTALACSSDIRLKHNITPLPSEIDNIMKLNPVTYNWNNESAGAPTHSGFIAQQVELFLPDLVKTDTFGLKSLNYAGFTPLYSCCFSGAQSQS
jgi:hypothetical protein